MRKTGSGFKRFFLTFSITILCVMNVTAQTHIGVEASYGISSANIARKNGTTPVIGVMAGSMLNKFLVLDFGFKYWKYNYSAPIRVTNYIGALVGEYNGKRSIENITVPISFGVYAPTKKVNILAKVIVAPGYVSKGTLELFEDSTSIGIDDYADGVYFNVGVEAGIGFTLSPLVSLDFKYSFLTYTSNLRLKDQYGQEYLSDERPYLNAIGLQLNFFLKDKPKDIK